MADPPPRHGNELSRTILPSSGTMIGICTGLVGLVKLLEGRIGDSRVDEVGGLIGLFFFTSAILSYLAIRLAERPAVSRRLERIADTVFVAGLFGIVGLTLLFAYEGI